MARKFTVVVNWGGCLEELRNAETQMDRDGFIGKPQWPNLRTGIHVGQFTMMNQECPQDCVSSEHTFGKRCGTNRALLTWPTSVVQDKVFQRR